MSVEAFLRVGNHPGLDLVNTVLAGPKGRRDLLQDWDDVARWAQQFLDVPEPAVPIDPNRALGVVVALREGLRALVVDPSDTTALDEALAAVPVRLASGGRIVAPPDATGADGVVVAIAIAVAEASDLESDRVRVCEGHQCILHFYDTSKAGRRRWHDMATCGNRAKQRRHREAR